MLSTITIGGNAISVVAMPPTPGFESIELNMFDAVAYVPQPFTGQGQRQKWPGADMWSGTVTMPKLNTRNGPPWMAFLGQLRGMANGFMLGDPMRPVPAGRPQGLPVADGGVAVAAGSETLYTKGWKAGTLRHLLPGDYLQLGYRLHMVMDVVSSDANGKAAIAIWPSLREVPADGEALVLAKPQGLFGLADNKRTWSSDYTRMSQMSFRIMEYR